MKQKPNPLTPPASALRRKAEQQLRKPRSSAGKLSGDADTLRLVHELQVHQIELEMQNAELQQTQLEMETALENYTELYDFAPVGYFSIDQNGLIQEVNLMGASMLGTVSAQLLQRRWQAFVAPASRPVIDAFLKAVFAKPEKHACEALLLTATDTTFWADLQAAAAPRPDSSESWCRLAVSDITALKRGEEAERTVQSLATAIQSANQEIARRRTAEITLKTSELTQQKMLKEARDLHAQLRHLTHQILLAQEEERKQISRQLHDEIAQILTGINVQLSTLSVAAQIKPGMLGHQIDKTKRLVSESIDIVHRFARNLRPTLLDDLGLIPALRSFVRELEAQHGLRIQFTAFAGVEKMDISHRTVLYRVTQEALTNVVRHAHATTATVSIQKKAHMVQLVVHDDGASFPAERLLAAKHGGRLGLLGMRERVDMIGGRFSIHSAPKQGTTITVEIPSER